MNNFDYKNYQAELLNAANANNEFFGKLLKEELGFTFLKSGGNEVGRQNVKLYSCKGEVIKAFIDSKEMIHKWEGVEVSYAYKKSGGIIDLIMAHNQLPEFKAYKVLEAFTGKMFPKTVDLLKEKHRVGNVTPEEEERFTKYEKRNYEQYESLEMKKLNIRKVLVELGYVPKSFQSNDPGKLTLNEIKSEVQKHGKIIDFYEGYGKAEWSEDAVSKMEKLLSQGGKERSLNATGAYIGRSPFDKNENAFITFTRGYFADSSGKQGDIISFVMETRNLDFPKTLEVIQDKYQFSKAKIAGEEKEVKTYYVKDKDRFDVTVSKNGYYTVTNMNKEVLDAEKPLAMKRVMQEMLSRGEQPAKDESFNKAVWRETFKAVTMDVYGLVKHNNPELKIDEVKAEVLKLAMKIMPEENKQLFMDNAAGREGMLEALKSTDTFLGRVSAELNVPVVRTENVIESGLSQEEINKKFGVVVEPGRSQVMDTSNTASVEELAEREKKVKMGM